MLDLRGGVYSLGSGKVFYGGRMGFSLSSLREGYHGLGGGGGGGGGEVRRRECNRTSSSGFSSKKSTPFLCKYESDLRKIGKVKNWHHSEEK